MEDFLNIVGFAGLGTLLIGYLWSFILGYRKSIGWLIGLLIIWFVIYPALVLQHWQHMKTNFFVVISGLILFITSALMS